MPIFFNETNVISLRSASVVEQGGRVCLILDPADKASLIPQAGKLWNFDWVSQDSTWLYRNLQSPAEEIKLMSIWPGIVDQDIRPMKFEVRPAFGVRWTDSGNGVALLLNGEPWAFIDEETRQGYSKGVLRPIGSNQPWGQARFERFFHS